MKCIMLLQKLLPPFIVQAFKTKTASHISRSILFVNSRPSIDLRPHMYCTFSFDTFPYIIAVKQYRS